MLESKFHNFIYEKLWRRTSPSFVSNTRVINLVVVREVFRVQGIPKSCYRTFLKELISMGLIRRCGKCRVELLKEVEGGIL